MTDPDRREWLVRSFGDPDEVLELVEVSAGSPAPREVRVAVAASGLNLLDVAICRGTHPLRPVPPFVLGAEFVGRVIEVGEGVRDVRVGERVGGMSPKGFGCFSDEVCVSEQYVYPVPDDVPDIDAAALLVTYQAASVALVRRARLSPGEWVLVSGGSGAFGSAITQIATALGGRVIALASSEERRRACLVCGAAAALPTGDDTLVKSILEITSGRGVDVVCDLEGGSLLSSIVPAVAFEGMLLSCGWVTGSVPTLDVSTLIRNNLTLGGVSWGATYPQRAPEVVRQTHAEILRMYRAGDIEPMVGQHGSYRDLPTLLNAIGSRSTIGKSVVEWKG